MHKSRWMHWGSFIKKINCSLTRCSFIVLFNHVFFTQSISNTHLCRGVAKEAVVEKQQQQQQRDRQTEREREREREGERERENRQKGVVCTSNPLIEGKVAQLVKMGG
jgi:hypothetical protein